MRLIINKVETSAWNEIVAETLIDWAKDEDKNTDDKTLQKKVKDWLANLKHGDILVFGAYRVIAIDLV